MKNLLILSVVLLLSSVAKGQSSCSQAVNVKVNDNLHNAAYDGDYWYAYTMPYKAKIGVSFVDNAFEYNVELYVNSCDQSALHAVGVGYTTSGELAVGDVVYIRLKDSRANDSFTLNIAVSPAKPGDACALAVEAEIGDNTLPNTSTAKRFWYRYVMPAEGRFVITSTSDKRVSVYSGACNALNLHRTAQGNIIVTSLSQGDEVFVVWETNRDNNFDWNLKVSPFETGDNCQTAKIIQPGRYTMEGTGAEEYWYKFVMPHDGRVKVTSLNNERRIAIGTCDNLNYVYPKDPFIAVQGSEIYVKWLTDVGDETCDWSLVTSPLQSGDLCDTAVVAKVGKNHLPASSLKNYWYRYTMPVNGTLRISSPKYIGFYLYDGDCSQLKQIRRSSKVMDRVVLSEGQEVYLKWSSEFVNNFDWTLSINPFDPGFACHDALEAALGTNQMPTTKNEDQWYRYTVPSRGNLSITSSSSEYVRFYMGSCVSLNPKGNGVGGVTVRNIPAGTEVLIKWALVFGDGNFEWNLAFESAKLSQYIYFDPFSTSSLLDESFHLAARTSSKLPIQYSSSDETVARISGDTIIYAGIGTTTITASQAGNENYQAAAVSHELTIVQEHQTITFDTLVNIMLDEDSFELTASASSGLPVHYTSSDETIATISGNMLTLIGKGTVTITAVQEGNQFYAAADLVSRTFSVIDCQQLTATAEVLCHTARQGHITVVAQGGEAPFQYSVDGITFQPMADFAGLDTGVHTFTVRDLHGCTDKVEAHVSSAEALKVEGAVTPSGSANDGSITLTVNGGRAPYSYFWSQGDTTATVENLSSGDYQVFVTDALGCSITQTFTVAGVTAIEEQYNSTLSIYPNPTLKTINIKLPTGSRPQTVWFYGLVGNRLMQVSLMRGVNRVDISTLKRGSYLLRFSGGSTRHLLVE